MIKQLIVKASLFLTGVQQHSAERIAHLLCEVFCFLNSQHWLSNLFFSYKKNSSDCGVTAFCSSILNASQPHFSFLAYV